MAVLFLIVKIIGIVVLVVVILLALVLFVPVTYRVEGDIDAKSAKARAGWLFGFLSIRFVYLDGETDFGVFILGIRAHKPKFLDRILELIRKRRSRANAAGEPPAEAGRASARSGSSDNTLPEDEIVVVKQEEDSGPDAGNEGDFEEDTGPDFEPDEGPGIFGRMAGRFGNGGFSFGRIFAVLKVLWKYKQKCLYGWLFQALKKFLFRARPRQLKGEVAFGFEDPAHTGQLLGVASVLPFVVNSQLKVEPDFDTEEMYFKGSAQLRGYLQLIFAVVLAVRLFTKKDFRRFLHEIRHS